jgi:hypothetical protein
VVTDRRATWLRTHRWLLPLAGVLVAGLPYVHVPAKSLTSAMLYDGFITTCAIAVAAMAARQPAGCRHP